MQRFTATERFLSLFTTLRPGEGRVALPLCFLSFVIMFAYYLLKVIREPMILADGSAELKAYSTAIQAILLMVIVPLFARLYQQVKNRNEKHLLFSNTLLFFISNLIAFALAYALGWPIAIAFYIWLGVFSVMILALFWAFATDLFNLKSGRRLFPLIAAASALGALLGAGIASWLDQRVGHNGVMTVAALLLLLPWWLCAHVDRYVPSGSRSLPWEDSPDTSAHLLEGFQIVWRSRYLTLIAGFVIVLNLINTNGEYILATLVTREAQTLGVQSALDISRDTYITVFYSQYLFITTLLSFLLQLFLVARIFDRIGINGALHILPVLMIINYSLMALIPVLTMARFVLVAENSVNYSITTTARHALFLPVSRQEKYVGKHTIDTFFYRVGDVLSGGFVYLASAVVGLGIVGFIGVNIALASILLLVSRAISTHHRSAVAGSFSNRAPVVVTPLSDFDIPSGVLSHLVLDRDTFIDHDEGDAMKYQAFAEHSNRLPGWVKFDSLNRKFQFNPPPYSSGNLIIRVVARDFDGLEAETSFTVSYKT
ncbi:MAG: ATP translocase [Halieaceae bacterium]|jgi:ATP:ADP antiporter, AAA family|nr:ATP translocase [Halieaceae bacterium]